MNDVENNQSEIRYEPQGETGWGAGQSA